MMHLTRRELETGIRGRGTAPVLDPTCEGLEVKFHRATRLSDGKIPPSK